MNTVSMKKRYINVSCSIDETGIETPREILWLDNRRYKIDRVIHTSCTDDYAELTVLIHKKQKKMYKERNGWYVWIRNTQ